MRVGPVEKYLHRRALKGPWRLEGDSGEGLRGAVVIPALAENETIGATLRSLAQNPSGELNGFLVVVVVNHRPDTPDRQKQDNRALLERLRCGQSFPQNLRLAWVDACSEGLELPQKEGGVGLARRIGFDLALPLLEPGGPALLVSLDADTLVEPGYLQAIRRHFSGSAQGAAVIPYRHLPAESEAQNRAMDLYELYLRHYVLGLRLAGSAYAYHSIGSALACRAEAYAAAGGMNLRRAGEDFYFLQQLAKTCGVSRLQGTRVHPSARLSRRTPFGTGRTVERQLAGDASAVRFYHAQAFRVLERWLCLAQSRWQAPAAEMLAAAALIDEELCGFLRVEGFETVWERFRAQHRTEWAFTRAFHGWFDALKTYRLIHHLCSQGHPEPREAVLALMAWGGLTSSGDIAEQLAILRGHQDAE